MKTIMMVASISIIFILATCFMLDKHELSTYVENSSFAIGNSDTYILTTDSEYLKNNQTAIVHTSHNKYNFKKGDLVSMKIIDKSIQYMIVEIEGQIIGITKTHDETIYMIKMI